MAATVPSRLCLFAGVSHAPQPSAEVRQSGALATTKNLDLGARREVLCKPLQGGEVRLTQAYSDRSPLLRLQDPLDGRQSRRAQLRRPRRRELMVVVWDLPVSRDQTILCGENQDPGGGGPGFP